MTMENYLVRVVVTPGEELPVWVAHCLTFNVCSQGETVEQAMAFLDDCIQTAIESDAEMGLDPRGRSAPSECWAFAREVADAHLAITEGAAKGWPRSEEGGMAVLVTDYTFPPNGSPPTFRRWARTHTVQP